MPIAVEVTMKIPGLTIRSATEPVRVINNSDVRFSRLIEVPAIPASGTALQVPVAEGVTFDCTVTQSDWHEEKSIFVVACRYARPRITVDDYNALVNSPDWTQKVLGA
jgi:hypothetical protein